MMITAMSIIYDYNKLSYHNSTQNAECDVNIFHNELLTNITLYQVPKQMKVIPNCDYKITAFFLVCLLNGFM
jgi:hypothetical protein